MWTRRTSKWDNALLIQKGRRVQVREVDMEEVMEEGTSACLVFEDVESDEV